MCVITLVETVRPSDEQVEQMWDQNPKGGGGVAWRELRGKVPVVRWKKGLTRAQMVELNNKLPMPYMLHFRQPSHDTSDSMLACHPFQVDEQATTGFEGTFEGYVLFHNGFWSEWRKKLESLCIASGGRIRMPSGAWSDSRALAFASHYIGQGFLEAANEKVICFGPGEHDIEMFGGPWLEVKAPGSEQTFIVSNRTWERTSYTSTDHRRHGTQALLNAAQASQTGSTGGGSQPAGFRSQNDGLAGTAGRRTNHSESIQETSQGSHQGVGGSTSEGPSSLGDGIGPGICANPACRKVTHVGHRLLGSVFCSQCWSGMRGHATTEHSPSSFAQLLGTCQTCKASKASTKTELGDKWMCTECWKNNGRPQIYYVRHRMAS